MKIKTNVRAGRPLYDRCAPPPPDRCAPVPRCTGTDLYAY